MKNDITLRQYLAGQAMIGLMMKRAFSEQHGLVLRQKFIDDLTQESIEYADSLIEKLSKDDK